jgi:hypothetical protein
MVIAGSVRVFRVLVPLANGYYRKSTQFSQLLQTVSKLQPNTVAKGHIINRQQREFE